MGLTDRLKSALGGAVEFAQKRAREYKENAEYEERESKLNNKRERRIRRLDWELEVEENKEKPDMEKFKRKSDEMYGLMAQRKNPRRDEGLKGLWGAFQERGRQLNENGGGMDMFGVGNFGGGRGGHWETRGTIFRGGEAYEEVKPRKKAAGRVPKRSQPPGYDGSYDMFGVGNFGSIDSGMGGMGDGSDLFGVGNFGGGFGGPSEPSRRRTSRRRR